MKRYSLLALQLLAGAQFSLAEPLALDWFSIDGGGGTSSGGVFTVRGTVGQPDAGRMSGDCDTVEGGFWGVVAAVPMPDAPLLRISRATGGMVIISWPASSTGFVLQETMSLSAPVSWTDVSTPVVIVGAEHRATVSAGAGSKFFRLLRLRCPP